MSPSREEILLSRIRTTVDRTEAEAREWERDRVAWNLPRDPRRAPVKPAPETPSDSGDLHDSTERAAEDG